MRLERPPVPVKPKPA